MGLNGLKSKEFKKKIQEEKKKCGSPCIYLLNSAANPAQFGLLNFFRYETIETRDLIFLSFIILASAGVHRILLGEIKTLDEFHVLDWDIINAPKN